MTPITVTKTEEKVETKVETTTRSSVKIEMFNITKTREMLYSMPPVYSEFHHIEDPNEWLGNMAGKIEILNILQSSTQMATYLTIVYREIN